MKYQSTRSAESVSAREAVLAGIARDGGLYVDPELGSKKIDLKEILSISTIDMAKKILSVLLPDFENMDALVEKAYRGRFETDDLTPLVKMGDEYILELFRGPTSAFKDVALSMLPQLETGARTQLGIEDRILILTATSGDTGKAALEGFHDVPGIDIMVFYPHEGVSDVQKAQMATQEGSNVRVCAVRGNFDDCQRGVKNAFAHLTEPLRKRGIILSSANSINIGRLAPQVVYYFAAYRDLVNEGRIKPGDPVNYVVPTGNFGDILAGFYAKLLGLPVGRLVCASNVNNVLTDFICTGVYDKRRPFYKTESPSMDILVSSNLERLLFIASGRKTEKVRRWMEDLNTSGRFEVDPDTLAYIQKTFSSWYCTKEETEAEIGRCWNNFHYLVDPHTAVATSVAEKFKEGIAAVSEILRGDDRDDVFKPVEEDDLAENSENKTEEGIEDAPVVVLSTASPYKFPTAILKALGEKPDEDEFEQMNQIYSITSVPIPKNLAELKGKPEIHKDVIEIGEIEDYILKNAVG